MPSQAFDQHGLPIAEVIARAERLGRDEYLRQYADPFLVTLADLSGIYDADRTELTQLETPRGLAGALRGKRRIPETAVAWIVRKQQETFPSKITLGRANNNDLAIPHRSISKFHAYFARRGEVWTITEAGSRNASKHNGVRITSELAPRAVNDRDVLQFGAAPEMLWVHAATLLDLLEWQRSPNAEG